MIKLTMQEEALSENYGWVIRIGAFYKLLELYLNEYPIEAVSDWDASEGDPGRILNKPFETLGDQFQVDENGVLGVSIASDIYYIEGAPLHIETGALFNTVLYKLGDNTFMKPISFTTVINDSSTVTDFSRIYFISPDLYNFTIIGASLNSTSSAYLVGGTMVGDTELGIRIFVTNEQEILTNDSGVVFSVNGTDPNEEGDVKLPIPQAGTGIEVTFDSDENPVFNMMPQILFEGPFDAFEDLPAEGISNTIYLVGEESPYEMWMFTEDWVSLGGLAVDLTGVVKSVNEILPDSSGNVDIPLIPGPQGDQGPQGDPGPEGPQGEPGTGQEFIVNKYTDVWSQPTNTEFDVDLKDFRFKLIKQSNGTYLSFLQNISDQPLSFFWRYSNDYDAASTGGTSVNAAVTLNPGDTSSYISNDATGLGYGYYPNTIKIEIINTGNGDKYVWESMSSGRGVLTSGGAINSVLTVY